MLGAGLRLHVARYGCMAYLIYISNPSGKDETMSKVDAAEISKMAYGVLAEIVEMTGEPIETSRGWVTMPLVASFGELHDYFDANVGWDAIPEDDEQFPLVGDDAVNAVFDRVHWMLFARFTADMEQRGWVQVSDAPTHWRRGDWNVRYVEDEAGGLAGKDWAVSHDEGGLWRFFYFADAVREVDSVIDE